MGIAHDRRDDSSPGEAFGTAHRCGVRSRREFHLRSDRVPRHRDLPILSSVDQSGAIQPGKPQHNSGLLRQESGKDLGPLGDTKCVEPCPVPIQPTIIFRAMPW